MRYLPLCLILAVSMVLVACQTTYLKSVAVDSTTASRRGAPYSLQFTQYKIVMTRRVTDCGSDFKTVNKAEISASLVDDGAHTYVIPLDSLNAATKISNLIVEYKDGRLTAVNAAAEDRSAQTILAAVQGVGKIATAVATGGAVGAGGPAEGCSDELIAQIIAREQAKKDIKTETRNIDRAKSTVTRMTAAYVASGNDASRKPALSSAINELDAATLRLEDAQERLKTALAFATYEITVTWPGDSSTFETSKPFEAPAAIFAKWYDMPRGVGETDAAWEARKTKKYAELADPMKMWFSIDRVGTYGRKPGNAEPTDSGAPNDGIRFRLPANGRLVVCEDAPCKRDANDAIVNELAGPVAQLGHIFYAPFASKPFTNGTFEMVLDASGRPIKLGVARKNSSAEAIANLGKDSAGEFAMVYGAMHKTPTEKAADELVALETEKKLADARAALDPSSSAKQLAALEMEKKLADARAALVISPTYELARLTAIAEQQKKYDDAINALKPGANAELAEQKKALESEKAVLTAESELIEAKIKLKDAQARLNQ